MKVYPSRQKTLKPKPRLNLVEFADQYRYLSGQSSALPGRWKTERVQPAREIMLAATDESVQQITIMSCSQLLKSEFLNNLIAYHVVNDSCPMILMQPTVGMAQSYSKDRIDPMIRETPVLNNLVKEKKSRDSSNTILHKVFPGGQLTMIGANSPSELASRPVRLIMCDEVDRYPESSGNEGDPIGLIYERSATFFNRKLVCCSTPTIAGRSRIEALYELSDKRVHCGTCPHCNQGDELKFENVKWTDNNPDTAYYVCPKCEAPWTETDRLKAIQNGYYESHAPFKGHAGFKITKLSSPWEPLSALVKKFLEAKDNQDRLKVFVNTQLAESWLERGEAPDYQRLYERRELYPINSVNDDVVFLTAGADVQADRIEVEIVGWCKDKQSYSVDYRYLMGDTSKDDVWILLDKVLDETFISEDKRELKIRMLAIDSGYNTQRVYNWVRKHSSDRVRAVKGSDSANTIVGTPKDTEVSKDGTKLRRAVKIWTAGVSIVKSELYSWLKLDKPEDGKPYPAGYAHFPQYDLEHFVRLCAEHLLKRTVKGHPVHRWEKKHERNEQLDCRVYARVAAAMFGLDRFSEKDFLILQGKYEEPKVESKPVDSRNVQTPRDVRDTNSKNDYWSRQKDKKKLF